MHAQISEQTEAKKPVKIIYDEDGDLIRDDLEEELEIQIKHKIQSDLDNVGYQVWRGALFMADFALDNQKLFENQNLLEIGAGTGLSSIILSNHCKTKEVFVTDLPDLLPLLKGVRL